MLAVSGLEGKKLVVTGSTGMAAAGARLLASRGASVFVVSVDPDSCVELTESIHAAGGSARWAQADLTDEDQAVTAFAAAKDGLGRIDGLFAVAGGSGRRFGDGPLHEIPLEGWTETLALNGRPAFLAVREAVRSMLDEGGGGSIVLVSSVLATSPSPELFSTHAYAAIKGAEISLASAMAAYYAPHGIRVNVIAPGLVRTPMSERAAADPAIVAFAERKQPLVGGMLEPNQVVPLAAFLLSDDAIAITGQSIAVDGGWSVSGD